MAVVKRPKATSTKGHYITNDVLLPEVLHSKKLGRVTNELAKMFMLIAERYSHTAKFAKYSFREDMVSFALINLMANGLKFDASRTNPFAYYTTAIYHSFLQYMADEKKHRNLRDALMLENGSMASSTFMDEAHDQFMRENSIYDDHGEIVHSGYNEYQKPIKETDIQPTIVEILLTKEQEMELRLKRQREAEAKLEEENKEKLVDYDD